MVLKIDMAQYVVVPHHSAKFHENPMKELVDNAVKTRLEEGLGLYDAELAKHGNYVRVFSFLCKPKQIIIINLYYD